MSTYGIDEKWIERIASDTFDLEVFNQTGVFVLRGAIAPPTVATWQREWAAFYEASLKNGRDVNRANPVALNEALPETLAGMYRDPALIDVARQVFGADIALYNHRFVIKDQFSRTPVFLHQDSCYHLGRHNKCSLFVPLSEVNGDNGGLSFYLGSHKLGFLGDAGEIDPEAFEIKWPKVTPEMRPGDFAIMHSSVWHESGPNVSGIDRIMADTIVQPADDPTGKELLAGSWRTDFFYSPINCIRYFKNSRVKKNMKFQEEIAELRASLDAANGQA
ncbi:phytanoyl-CoA dioxygenase family protein [Bordetella genomosp. 11]|uniref:Phytanoyl-CoA dioxygenase n=1 Tax=Bordetella genomosp. 11 TaxID=1416808 RepID=A0A261UFT2_9BORD|nr:phytanoyl-CoA dioxygenase family protein [Bordetella genomosp. 11]OZI60272.1 phytanoyl-CoA dioxygenase [Bordetella genomosp. 11]